MAIIYEREDVQNGLYATQRINAELERIRVLLREAVSRVGTNPNYMEADLDMNLYDILNVNMIDVKEIIMNGERIPTLDELLALRDQLEQMLIDMNDAAARAAHSASIAGAAATSATNSANQASQDAATAAQAAIDAVEAAQLIIDELQILLPKFISASVTEYTLQPEDYKRKLIVEGRCHITVPEAPKMPWYVEIMRASLHEVTFEFDTPYYSTPEQSDSIRRPYSWAGIYYQAIDHPCLVGDVHDKDDDSIPGGSGLAPYEVVLSARDIDHLRSFKEMQDGQSANIVSTGRAGLFRWQAGDLSAEVAADPLMGIYVPPVGQDGSAGAWVREFAGAFKTSWWGDATTWDCSAMLSVVINNYESVTVDTVISCRNSVEIVRPGAALNGVTPGRIMCGGWAGSTGSASSVFSVKAPGVSFDGVSIDGELSAHSAIYIHEGADGASVSGCEITRVLRNAVRCDANNCRIFNNHLHHLGDLSTSFVANGVWVSGRSSGAVITSNTITDVLWDGTTVPDGNGVQLVGDSDGTSLDDDSPMTATQGVRDVVVSGNIIKRCARRGVKVQTSYVTCSDNILEDASIRLVGGGLKLYGVKVVNNTILRGDFNNGGTFILGCNFSGNTIICPGEFMGNQSGGIIRNTVISDNDVYMLNQTQVPRLFAFGSSAQGNNGLSDNNVRVEKNRFYNVGVNDSEITPAYNGTLRIAAQANNIYVKDNWFDVAYSTIEGVIRVTTGSSSGIEISGNTFVTSGAVDTLVVVHHQSIEGGLVTLGDNKFRGRYTGTATIESGSSQVTVPLGVPIGTSSSAGPVDVRLAGAFVSKDLSETVIVSLTQVGGPEGAGLTVTGITMGGVVVSMPSQATSDVTFQWKIEFAR